MDARQTPPSPLNRPSSAPVRYVYRRPLPLFLARCFDRLGPRFMSRRPAAGRTRPLSFAHIAVIRADQIGDIVLALPYISALRRRYPHARVTLVTTSAGQALLQTVPGLCETRAFNPPWFAGDRGTLQAMRDLRALLKDLRPDAVVDLRGDVRHLWVARRALPDTWIEGYGITGGGFLADRAPAYPANLHAALKNFSFMDVPVPTEPLSLPAELAAQPLNRRVRDLLPEKKSLWVAFHIGAGADSKRWPEAYWKKLAERVSRETDAHIVWIGDRDADDRSRIILSLLDAADRGRSTVLCHLLGLGELNTLLARCELLVTHDSGPAHVAAARKIPTLVLFSGANDTREWRPLNPNAVLLSHPVPCSPCGLKVCNQPRHFCMEGIEPDRVFEKVKEMMRVKG